jgi:MFS family permease
MSTREVVDPVVKDPPFPPAKAAWYAVCLFGMVNVLDNIDRGIFSMLIEPIKRDLLLSDFEVSLLGGIAFAFFYGLVGLPMSRFADTGNRRNILSFGIALWSLATAAGALAKSFGALFISRGFVGAGEAMKGPNAISMISDLVPRQKYPSAMAIYNFGISVGSALALIIGGFLLAIYGGTTTNVMGVAMSDWQMVLLIVGLPGVLIAALVFFSIKEPARRGRERTDKPPVSEIFKFLWRERKFYFPFLIGAAFLQIEIYGLLNWRMPFYERTYGWGPEDVGPILGTMSLVITPFGLLLGAIIGERMAARYAGAMIILSIVGTAITLPLSMATLFMPTAEGAIVLTGLNYIAMGIAAPASTAALQTVTPNEYRGQVFAAYAFTISVVGTGLGFPTVAAFTDFVFQDESALRYSMFWTAAIFGTVGFLSKFVCYAPYKARVQAIMDAEQEVQKTQ